jgi:hypothetical protein
MSSLASQLRRIQWLLVPIVAYLAITLVLPVANGAAGREDFARHASLVLGACVVAVAITLAFNALIDVLRRRL